VLVDKQRTEYMQAYEHHMSDVQRELFNLREKATAIANDTTREEKIKKLDSDQKWFRNEAMKLDVETNEYRRKMRDIKVMIQSTGVLYFFMAFPFSLSLRIQNVKEIGSSKNFELQKKSINYLSKVNFRLS
jgi:hypothetical protein